LEAEGTVGKGTDNVRVITLDTFYPEVSISEIHDRYLPETYFPIVGGVCKYPRYQHKRCVDAYPKMYLDEMRIILSPDWDLSPKPNEEAAYMSMHKYMKDILQMTETEVRRMNRSWAWLEEHFGPYMRDSKVLDVETVVSKLDKNTSSGVPFNRIYATKRDLFEKDPEIMEWLEKDWEELAREDTEWYAPWTNSLKEEIRPSEKNAANKIRTFTASPVDLTVHGNRLFADMNERMNVAHTVTSSTVGFTPMRGGWSQLINKLRKFKKGYALDESEYDSSLRTYLMWGCAQFRWKMLRKEDQTPQNLRRLLQIYKNIVHSLIVSPEGVLVLKLQGNPSGSPNTINDNTIILRVLLNYAWLTVFEDDTSYAAMEAHTAFCLTGDDNTWSVSDEAHDKFNGKTVIEVWKTLGVTTTSDTLEPRDPIDLDYLSATTVYQNGIPVPQYNYDKLMASLLYSNRQMLSPAFALTRLGGILTVGWTNLRFRRFARQYEKWLKEKFEPVCFNDEDWILAKTTCLSDSALELLWLGQNMQLWKQALTGSIRERMIHSWYCEHCRQCENLELCKDSMPDKMSTVVTTKTIKAGRKGRGGRRAGKKPVQATQTVVQTTKSVKNGGKRRIRKRRNDPSVAGFIGPKPNSMNATFQRRQQTMLTAKGSSRNQTTNRKMMVIEEDEYIGEVTGAATAANFGTTAYPVNMGQAGTFPWGAGVVKNNFEKYRFDYVRFYYKREVSEFATNGTTGKVMLSFDADAADPPPSSKQQVEDTDPHVDGMPCENMQLDIPAAMLRRMNDGFYIRPGGLPGGTDIKTYDVGNLYVSTQGLANNSAVVGELHVRYRCQVFIPILEASTTVPANNQVSLFQSTTNESCTTAVAKTLALATTSTNGLNIVNTSGSMVPTAGNYLVDIWMVGADSTNEAQIYVMDLKKNGTTVTVGTNVPEYRAGNALGSNDVATLAASYFVTANGTDAFTMVATITGAAGTLTAQGSCRWVAV